MTYDSISRLFVYHHYMPRRTQSHTLHLWKVWPCTGDRAIALTTASLRGTTRGITGQWRVYILKCGSLESYEEVEWCCRPGI